MKDSNSQLVYSTDGGRIEEPKQQQTRLKGDGIIRIRRETKGRKGKGVITISGIDKDDNELKKICTELKKKCGTGGALKDGIIEIQGDNREKVMEILQKQGFTVKLAGG
ncbi:stress response translation initiation inhibitor YciH [Neptunicella marina]|uniref:Stress response translation initiation inhibitor YciH n=1 Tax=Neptunicella marina TaxID=2125989 RepID=A0A8J6M2J0_9ALTE|nr:stress response translation initiation inhibitor YciH [Neptunicella marina]MBC3764421.1 stress response translation initiation inhibitor YciH [Neptunicella marina]